MWRQHVGAVSLTWVETGKERGVPKRRTAAADAWPATVSGAKDLAPKRRKCHVTLTLGPLFVCMYEGVYMIYISVRV